MAIVELLKNLKKIYFCKNNSTMKSINCNGVLLNFEEPKIMGILNLTSDSFYEKSRKNNLFDAIEEASNMLKDGADIIDIGAMSTRPGLDEISQEEELNRLLPVLIELRKKFPKAIFSIDTYRSEVANIAFDHGADIINDISGGTFDENMFRTIAKIKAPYVLMHTSDKPKIMQQKTQYNNILCSINLFFGNQIEKLYSLGVKDVIIDPGFGFGKTSEQGFHLLKNLSFFSELNVPILAGISRKSMIYKTLNTTPENALTGTIVLNLIALQNGASILRVHDVKEAVEVKKLFLLIKNTF